MTTAAEVIAHCRSRGVELTAAGDRLRFRAPAGAVDAELRAELAARKEEVIAALAVTCPTCHKAVGADRKCWKCCDRACLRCGRPTGSVFIMHCWSCQSAAERGESPPL